MAGEPRDRPVYLDHHATTPLDPQVLDAMMPWLTERVGNASSRTHRYGWDAKAAVDHARAQVAALIGGRAKELVFTSGATESNNLALRGVLDAVLARGEAAHLITVATEHRAVLDVARGLERRGATVTILPVDAEGRVSIDAVRAAIGPNTRMISVMWVNNEVGTVQPIAAIGALAKERGVLFHCDAVQGLSTMQLDVEQAGVDLVSLSAHKMYGPQGVGALWVRRRAPRVRLTRQMDGGGQEDGLRAGTLNVAGIVGMGRAAELAVERRDLDRARVASLRDRLQARLVDELGGVTVNGPQAERHPGNLHLSLDGIDAEALMLAVANDVAMSSGSACASAGRGPSHVLEAMGLDREARHDSLRIGVGRTTAPDDIERAADALIAAGRRLRG